MSLHFHTLTIEEVKKETADCVSVLFSVPASLKKEFAFEAGQNISLKKNIAGIDVRRSYSICTAPFENKLRIAIKKVAGGLFSEFANTSLKPGDSIEVLPPTGKFNTTIDAKHKKNYVAFAAGSGITPVLSLIKTILKEEPLSTFTLVYGNKNRHSIIFFEELEAIKNKYLQRFILINVLSREKTDTLINFGRVDAEKLKELGPIINYNNTAAFFICGPAEMIFCVQHFLENQGIDKRKIHFELFGTTGTPKKNTTEKAENSSNLVCAVTVKTDGTAIEFPLALDSEDTILDAALKQGADLPYACKGGMCCTCKAKLVEGQVTMNVHWGLEQEEIDKGYILTCQAYPKTEKVIIDFDVK